MLRTIRFLMPAALAVLFSLLVAASAEAAPIPDGSYRASCKNMRATANVLRANCETRRGGHVETRLNGYRSCRGDIANDNGRLICREPDLTLYEHSRYRGRALFIDNDLATMARSFDDRTSSIRVRRGDWHVCADSNYGGRCVTVSADVPDLARLGLNDRISSVRRAVQPPKSEKRDEGERDDAVPPPDGTYLKTCRNVRAADARLFAECKDRGGKWRSTDLDFSDCPGEIRNDNGRLSCSAAVSPPPPPTTTATPPARPRTSEPPSGSYRQSCRGISVMSGTLTGECKAKSGVWRTTALILRMCAAGRDIANDNGVLTCSDGPAAPTSAPPAAITPSAVEPAVETPLPEGSYQQSCRNIGVDAEGGTLTAECRDTVGVWNETSILLRTCSGAPDITNDDGILTCAAPFGRTP